MLSDLAIRAKASHGYDARFMEACRAEWTFAAHDLGRLAVPEVGGSPAGVVGLAWCAGARPRSRICGSTRIVTARGSGRLLVEHALAAARSGGAATVRVEADPGAAPFYARMGFVTVGTAPSRSIPQCRLPLMAAEL